MSDIWLQPCHASIVSMILYSFPGKYNGSYKKELLNQASRHGEYK